MKFTISKEKLLGALQKVQNIVTNRPTRPILSNVLITTNNGTLQFTTADLDIMVQSTVEAHIEEEGSTTIPAKYLFSIIRELVSSEIHFSVDSDHVTRIQAGTAKFTVNGLDKQEFPLFPSFENVHEFRLPQKDLLDGLRKTFYAISADETRYVLNGIMASFKENKLTLVATDGRRLAVVDFELEFPQSMETEFIIPTKAINELQRTLSDEGEIRITTSENQVAFHLANSLIISKLVDGNYPNYRQVIPGAPNERITIEREPFLNAIRRVAVINTGGSLLKLQLTRGTLTISAEVQNIASAEEELAVQYTGRDLAIGFDSNFLMDPLRHLTEDEIYLDLIDEMSAGVIKTNSPFLYVIMPMRLA